MTAMAQSKKMHVQEKNGFVWIKLPDAVNMDNYVAIEEEMGILLPGSGPKVVLDLAATHNLYSSGLGMLIRLRKRICDAGGVLYLVNVSQKIQDILKAVNLERLFTVYATDVEFEISCDDLLEKQLQEGRPGFVFVARVEKGACRISMSGRLSMGQDFSALSSFAPDAAIKNYVFDLTGLDMVDTSGIHVLSQLFVGIHKQGGAVVTYGGDEFVAELFRILDLNEIVTCYKDEREALEGIGKTA
jgi:anti-anti-sigma factor